MKAPKQVVTLIRSSFSASVTVGFPTAYFITANFAVIFVLSNLLIPLICVPRNSCFDIIYDADISFNGTRLTFLFLRVIAKIISAIRAARWVSQFTPLQALYTDNMGLSSLKHT